MNLPGVWSIVAPYALIARAPGVVIGDVTAPGTTPSAPSVIFEFDRILRIRCVVRILRRPRMPTLHRVAPSFRFLGWRRWGSIRDEPCVPLDVTV